MDDFLTIGIVTHNSGDVIENCLSSIKTHYPDRFRIIIADNDSADSTHEIVTSQFPQVEIFNTGKNYGFGYGVNYLLSKASTKYVLVLNADIEILPGTIEPLINTMNHGDMCVVSAPVTVNSENDLEGNIRRFPGLVNQFFESVIGGKIASKINKSETVTDPKEYTTTHKVDWIKGAIWCIRRETFENLGGMRTDFFLYSEETEFAHRAAVNGFHSIIVSDSKAMHMGGESDTNQLLYTLLALNKIFYMKLSSGKIQAQIMRIILIIALLLRINKTQCRFALKSMIRSLAGFEKERLKIISKLNGTLI